ncbi:MAG: hemolysin family protein, partial [Parvularculaceae bacterium]
FFAMSELAIVSARRTRLEQSAAEGDRGAERALKLRDDPTGFLSTVQVGITLIGVVAGAYSGVTFAEPFAEVLRPVSFIGESAEAVAFLIVVVGMTYLSLIVGELVPKRIALNNSEAIASFAAGPMTLLAAVGAPVIWFLRLSTVAILKLVGVEGKPESTVTEEEVKAMITEGAESGVFEEAERSMLEGVLRLADRPVRAIMVPRMETVWLSANDPPQDIMREIRESGFSRFPVCRDEVDDVIGILHVKDLVPDMDGATAAANLQSRIREPLFVNETMTPLKLLDRFRESTIHMAIVLDEYGAFQGVVTPNDILTAIAGTFPERAGDDDPYAVKRADGSWLLDASMPIDAASRVLEAPPIGEGADYVTLAGFLLELLGRIPAPGETVEAQGWRFEIVDLDGRRIDKVIATRLAEETVASEAAESV